MSGEEMMKFATCVYNKHFKNCGVDRCDLISEGVVAILKHQDNVDTSIAKGSTYLYMCVYYDMLHYCNKELAQVRNESIDSLVKDKNGNLSCVGDFIGLYDNYEIFDKCEIDKLRVLTVKNKKVNKVFSSILDGKSSKDIKKEFGISNQYFYNMFSRLKKMCLENFEYVNGEIVEKNV